MTAAAGRNMTRSRSITEPGEQEDVGDQTEQVDEHSANSAISPVPIRPPALPWRTAYVAGSCSAISSACPSTDSPCLGEPVVASGVEAAADSVQVTALARNMAGPQRSAAAESDDPSWPRSHAS